MASYASFVLIGWSGLFIPSLLLVLKEEFGRTDAEFGLVYFIGALLFATGALLSGLVAAWLGRRAVLLAASLLIGVGLALEGVAPAWPVFLMGAGLAGAGCGAIDALVSSVIMDLSASGSGSGLNMLHLFYSVGALVAPLVIGVLVGLGVEWRLLALAGGAAGFILAWPLARAGSVPARPKAAPAEATADRATTLAFGPQLALAALGVAIACYVASESGVSSWLVGFLADQPMTAATLALSLFWAGLAVGRLVASRVADRFAPVRFTTTCAVAGGIAIVAAVAVPYAPVRIALFGAAGFAFGPVYPMILAVGGSLFPHRAAAVAGIITASAVVGSITYPPAMGLMAGIAGLAAGMLGAGLLIFASGAAVVVAGRLAGGRTAPGRAPEPVVDPPPS